MKLTDRQRQSASRFHGSTVPIALLLAACLSGGGVRPGHGAESAKPANIVLIVADDLGFADVGFHGGAIKTPAIDRIAIEGVRLERFYACPICSPTRAGLMTGRYPIRFGIMRSVIPPWCKWGLPPEEQTLGEMLEAAGYPTRAVVGKWHLGHAERKYHPLRQGFTHFYGHYNGALDYFTHVREGQLDWHRGFDAARDAGYTTDLIGDEAVRVIRAVPADSPFFLYVPFNAPHNPYQAHRSDVDRFPNLVGNRRIHAAMVTAMDRAIGRILDALDGRGMAEDTFVLFFSDNGGVHNVADNGPLRAGKGTVCEGGIRVAAAARWPAGRVRGGMEIGRRMGYIDVFPTLRAIAGLDAPASNPLDGMNVLDAIRGEGDNPPRDWFSFIAMRQRESIAINTDTWKMVVRGESVLARGADRQRKIELFQIDRDPFETADVSGDHPVVVAELLKKLEAFRKLQTPGVGPYGPGRDGFVAPEDWNIPE